MLPLCACGPMHANRFVHLVGSGNENNRKVQEGHIMRMEVLLFRVDHTIFSPFLACTVSCSRRFSRQMLRVNSDNRFLQCGDGY